MKFERFGFATSGLLLLVLIGCGDDSGLAPVSGTVTLDGKPLTDAGVMFHPDAGGLPATGSTDAEGKFTLTTREPGDGAMIGMNKVAVIKSTITNPDAVVEEGQIVDQTLETPVKYGLPSTSGISIDVKRGMDPVSIELKSGK